MTTWPYALACAFLLVAAFVSEMERKERDPRLPTARQLRQWRRARLELPRGNRWRS